MTLISQDFLVAAQNGHLFSQDFLVAAQNSTGFVPGTKKNQIREGRKMNIRLGMVAKTDIRFGLAQYVSQFLFWHKQFVLAQNILYLHKTF